MSFKVWFIPFVLIFFTLSGCSDHDDDPIVFIELQVTASQNPVPVNFQSQLTATAFYSDGHSNSIDSTWESLDETIATVDYRGMVTAISPGQVTIQASITEGSGTFLLTVSEAAITSIQLDPLFAEMPVGHNIQYNAQGYFSDGSNHSINDHPDLVWISKDETVAVIDKNTARSDTLSEGVTEITAVLNANTELAQTEVRSNTTQLTVTSHVLQTISISPDRVTWPLGLTQQFTAEGIFSDGDTLNISGDVIWSSEPDGVLELIDDEGNKGNSGIFKGIAVGSSNVSASYKGLVSENTAAFVVEQMEMTNFTVDSATGEDTQPLGKEVQFKALAEFTDGNSYDVSGYKQVHWQSSDTSIATVTVSGVVKGLKLGNVIISAKMSYGNSQAQKNITITEAVIESIVVQPVNGNYIISELMTQKFDASARYSNGDVDEDIEEQSGFEWTTETNILGHPFNPSEYPEVSIDQQGIVTYEKQGRFAGFALIHASLHGISDQEPLLLPNASLIVVSDETVEKEFIGTLTEPEAIQLEVEYTRITYEELDNGDYFEYIVMTHSESEQYCEQLQYNGQSDWRLPSSEELVKLWQEADGVDDVFVFSEGWVFSKTYWSSTAHESGHSTVSLVDASINNANDDVAHYASCVRTR